MVAIKIVYVYGPPGVGKLTVARALSKRTGFKLADNHTTIDWARGYFDFGSERFWRLESRLRDVVFEEATAADLSLIATFLAPTAVVMAQADQYGAGAERTGGSSYFVQLTCERSVLEKRVQSAGRAETGKLTSVEVLRGMLARPEFSVAPEPDTLVIDNTRLQPDEVARLIVDHFRLVGAE